MTASPIARAPLSSSGLADRDIEDILTHAARWTNQLRGARLLVTGATGWFGTWLLDALVALDRVHGLGLRVYALSRDPRAFAARHPLLAHAACIEWMRGDVRDADLGVDGPLTHVLHAAAESSTTLSAASDATMRETIVAGTRNVLAIARRAGARRVLFVSSGAVYGPQPDDVERLSEDHPCLGSSAYATGKRDAERLVLDATDARCATAVARCFAFVGPHMPFDAHLAIGNFIRDAIDTERIVVTGDGTPRRSLLYMSDLVVWLLTLLCESPSRGVFNVGSSHGLGIADIARRCANAERDDERREIPVCIQRRSVGGPNYVPSVSRAANELRLHESVSLDEAIARTMRWRRRRVDAAAPVAA